VFEVKYRDLRARKRENLRRGWNAYLKNEKKKEREKKKIPQVWQNMMEVLSRVFLG